jgi:hypothetical protein
MRPISVGINPTAGATTTVYTVPTGYYALFNLLYVHNTGANNKNLTVQWYDASAATSIDILTAVPYNSKAYTQFDNAYVVFEEGDQLRVTPEAASAFVIIATFEQIGLTRQ